MIRRDMKMVELRKIGEEQKDFGSEIFDVLVGTIEIAIYERNVFAYNQNNIEGIQYDYIGLTKYDGCKKGLYIKDGADSYKINFVQNSKRYKQVFLERVI